MTVSDVAAELARERAAHRETVAALETERTERAEEKRAALAMMEAIDTHLAALRARLDVLVRP